MDRRRREKDNPSQEFIDEICKLYDDVYNDREEDSILVKEIRCDVNRNGFVKTCCQQEIDQLKAEKEDIEAEVIG